MTHATLEVKKISFYGFYREPAIDLPMAGELLYLFILLLIALRNFLAGASLVLPGTLLAVFLLAVLLRERAERQRTDFLNQLKSQRKELRAGGTVAVDGLLLRYDTVLSYYVLSVGTLFTNVNIPTQYSLHHGESHPEAFACSIVTLLTGWWSISGPQTTIAVILQNLRGGDSKPVSLLIDAGLIDEQTASEGVNNPLELQSNSSDPK